MVNLRYHIVTLVAVFLALGLGVVLGAGPLQNRIKGVSEGTNYAERVAQLETDADDLRQEADQQDTFIMAVSDQALPGTLDGKDVAVLTLPATDEETTSAITETVELGGGEVVGVVELTSNWSSAGQREYRDTLASPVSSHLSGSPSSNVAEDILGQALFEVLTTSGSETDLLREILSDQEVPLVVADTLPEEKANAIIILGPADSTGDAPRADGDEEDDPDTARAGQSFAGLANAMAAAPKGAVAVGSAAHPDDFISLLRANSADIATVDQGGTAMANLNAALALHAGDIAAYGQQEGADAALAPLAR